MFLYILPFESEPILKIGVTETIPQRLATLHRQYNSKFDSERSVFIYSQITKEIWDLEAHLKKRYSKYPLPELYVNKYYGKTGFNELFNDLIYDEIINDLERAIENAHLNIFLLGNNMKIIDKDYRSLYHTYNTINVKWKILLSEKKSLQIFREILKKKKKGINQ